MRNVCRTIDDFLENLRIEIAAFVVKSECPIHRKSIFLTCYGQPVGENKRDPNAVKFNVVVHVGAVISTEEGEYLLECAEIMGIDYRDASNELEGTEKSDLVVAKIKDFCQDNGLTIRPGAISY